jgi:beta-glucosidase/6-phospho-beta-glucosidase/beta-galactosidase
MGSSCDASATQVTENGVPVPDESEKPLQEALRDSFRLEFYRGYIEGLCQAVQEDGVNLTGYYAWSLMDNFECEQQGATSPRVAACVQQGIPVFSRTNRATVAWGAWMTRYLVSSPCV